MAQLTLRSTRDSALTWEEGDANLLALDSDSPWKVSENHITYDGKVGIAVDSTYSPVYDLDFGNGDSATVGITNGDLVVHVDGPNQLKVWNNTVQSITVKTTGKVGINDSDPSEMLTVGGNIRASNTILGNVISANSITDGYLTLSAGNVDNIKRLTVLDDNVQIQFGNLYSKTSARRIEDWDSSLTNFGNRVPTSQAVSVALGVTVDDLTDRMDSLTLSLQSQFDSFETQVNADFNTLELNLTNQIDSLDARLSHQFDSFEAQVNADFNSLELNLTNQIDSLDTSLNLQITNLINDQNEAFDSLELSLNTQINNLEISLQNQIDSLDASLNLSITNLINDQNQAFDSLEGSINATLASYDLDGVLAVGNTSTRSMTVGALTSTTINTQNNNITAGTGSITSGAITSTTINTQNNNITAGSGTVTGSEFVGKLNGTLKNARTINGVSFDGSANIANTFNNGVKITGSTISMSGSYTGTFTASGDVVAFSDVALKSNISPITEALERVSQIGGYTYNKIGDDHKRTGVLAQEIQEVLPEAVHTNEEGVLGVAYGNLTGLLIEAVKELSARVKELESK